MINPIQLKKLIDMYKHAKPSKTTLNVNTAYEGETIEQKVRRIINNKEPIKDGAPLTYTERKEGVKPEYDIRTDRWELATEAMDKVSKNKLAKREERNKPAEEPKKDAPAGDKPAGADLPTQGTE